MPSFDEIWPQPGKEKEKEKQKAKRMGLDYILEVSSVEKTIFAVVFSLKVEGEAEGQEDGT